MSDSWIDRSPHQSHFVHVNGVKLNYLDWGGEGETILFLPGGGDGPHIYDEFAPRFTERFRVLGLARRGTGQSETGTDLLTFDLLAEDLRWFLDHLEISKVHLVGHSISGDILTRFATLYPERVEKLIYLDGAIDRSGLPEVMSHCPVNFSMTKDDFASIDHFRRYYQRVLGRWSDTAEANLRDIFSPDLEQRLQETFHPLMQASFALRPDYSALKHPTLAIYSSCQEVADFCGEENKSEVFAFLNDPIQPYLRRQIERLKASGDHVHVVVMQDTNHYLFLQWPDRVVEEMRAFLGDSSPQ